MAGLLDIFGGGSGSADDPYADILTPAQRNQMQTQGLLAMAGAFAQAGMPSRLPVPFGSALGSAAAALGTGQEAGMKTAIENALAAQKVRDLRSLADYRKTTLDRLSDPTSPLMRAIAAINSPGGAAPTPGAAPGLLGGGGAGAGARTPGAPAAAADAPLIFGDALPYPNAPGAGLLGGDVGAAAAASAEGEYGGGQKLGGLLGPGPAAGAHQTPAEQATMAVARAAYDRAAAGTTAPAAAVGPLDTYGMPAPPGYELGGTLPNGQPGMRAIERGTSGSSSGAPAELPTSAGGDDTPMWGPTFPQQGASRVRGAPTPEMTDLIVKAADENKLPPQIMHGLLGVESNFNPDAVSPTGAKGIAQFISSTARSMKLADPFDPQQAIPKSAEYLAQLRDQYGGDLNKALMAYNAGGDQSKWNPGYATAVNRRAGEFVPPEPFDAGWGPTFAQGGPDRVIPSGPGAGGNLPAATLAQYPGAGGAPMPAAGGLLGAPSAGSVLAAPGPAVPPGGDPAKVNALLLELARQNAASEVLGLGNPYNSLLNILQGSPGYKGQIKGAEEAASEPYRQIARDQELKNALIKEGWQLNDKGQAIPVPLYNDVAAARANAISTATEGPKLDSALAQQNKMRVYDAQGHVMIVPIPGGAETEAMGKGLTASAEAAAKAPYETKDVRVVGPDGQPATETMTVAEFNRRQALGAKNAAMGATPKPGDIIGAPITGTVPEGYQLRTSPQGGLTAEPIPNTPAAQALQDRMRKQAVADQATLVARDIMVQNTNRIEDLVQNSGLPVTGTAGPFLSRIGGTAANDVRVMIETMKARSSLDQLNQMRNSNPQGAGLGNVSNAEGDRLAAAISNLDQSQTKDQFLFNLRRLKQEYIDIVHGPGTYSKLSDEPVLKVPGPGQTAIGEGTIIENPQTGERRIRRNGNWEAVPK